MKTVVAVRDRRPVGLRENPWVRAVADWLARRGLRPNQVSLASVGCGALTAAALLLAPSAGPLVASALYLAAAGFILLRGMCNLCDGLMAVEGGLHTRSGEVFNDLPDRISDPLMLVAAGYALAWPSWGPALGWLAALLAVLTAYVRLLGGAAGAAQPFCGPMAKTHRMTVVALACGAAALEPALGLPALALPAALVAVVVGCLVTIARRTARIVRELESA